MRENQTATAQLDHYLAANYPHLFSNPYSQPSSNLSSQTLVATPVSSNHQTECVTNLSSANASPSELQHSSTSPVLKDCPECLTRSLHSKPWKRPLKTANDSFDRLSHLSNSPKVTLSDDECGSFLESDENISLFGSDEDSIDQTTFKLKRHTNYSLRSVPGKSTIEAKVEELLSEYRDGLESSWFRTPDQSNIFDDDSSDDVDASQYALSETEAPDTIEAVWRQRPFRKETVQRQNKTFH